MSRIRIGLAIIGFLLALVSVALNDARTGWAAIAALLCSMIIRLVQRKRDKPSPGV